MKFSRTGAQPRIRHKLKSSCWRKSEKKAVFRSSVTAHAISPFQEDFFRMSWSRNCWLVIQGDPIICRQRHPTVCEYLAGFYFYGDKEISGLGADIASIFKVNQTNEYHEQFTGLPSPNRPLSIVKEPLKKATTEVYMCSQTLREHDRVSVCRRTYRFNGEIQLYMGRRRGGSVLLLP